MAEEISNKVVIVTGANTGVGFGAAQILCSKQYEVILACRNDEKGAAAVDKIRAKVRDAKVEYHQLDLADKSSIEAFSNWFLSTGKPLHALVNNAGVLLSDGTRQTTKDGFELTFGTNHLGHFLFTMLLLPKLKETAASAEEGRIVNVASRWHDADKMNASHIVYKSGVDLNVVNMDFTDLNLEKPDAYGPLQAYKNSKAANIMFTKALSRSLDGIQVTTNAMRPGFLPSTEIFRHNSWMSRLKLRLVDNFLLRGFFNIGTLDSASNYIADLVDGKKYKGITGKYFDDAKDVPTSEETNDAQLQDQLWNLSCDMLGKEEFKSVLKPAPLVQKNEDKPEPVMQNGNATSVNEDKPKINENEKIEHEKECLDTPDNGDKSQEPLVPVDESTADKTAELAAREDEHLTEKNTTMEPIPENASSESAASDNTRSDNHSSELVKENTTSYPSMNNSDVPHEADKTNPEAVPERTNSEAVPEKAMSETRPEDSETVPIKTNSEHVPEMTNSETVPELTNSETVPEKTNSENPKSEPSAKSADSGEIMDNAKSDTVLENRISEQTLENKNVEPNSENNNTNSEPKDHNIESITENVDSLAADGNTKTDSIIDTEQSKVTTDSSFEDLCENDATLSPGTASLLPSNEHN